MAEQVAKQRKAHKNTGVRGGGQLTVDHGRDMVTQAVENEDMEVLRKAAALEARYRNIVKKGAFEAAKEARRWRITDILGRLEVTEAVGQLKLLKRG